MVSLVIVAIFIAMMIASYAGLIAKDWNKERGVSYANPSFLAGAENLEAKAMAQKEAAKAPPVDLSDAVVLIQYQFLSGAQPTCFDAADPDDNGIIDLSDPIYIINYLFLAGPIPLQPGPQDCGVDPSADPLDPCVYTSC